MKSKYFEWHTALSLHRRLRGLVPRSTLCRWIEEKKIRTHGQRANLYAFDPDQLEEIELQETSRRLRLAAEALPTARPEGMTDDELAASYVAADSQGQSNYWSEISRRRDRDGQAIFRAVADAQARRGARLQPMLDKFAGVYWNPQTKQTTKTQGQTK